MVLQKFLIFALVIMSGSASVNAQVRLGRTTGMTQEQALKIAVDCVRKAAGLTLISGTREIPHYRLEDKLEFLGITDATRLNALRRYLVRNEEIGTQSIEFIQDIDPTHRRFYRYMLTSHDLLTVKKDWTLLKLAQHIADKSGIAKMPITTARAILADCKAYALKKDLVDLTPPPTPTPSPTPLAVGIGTTLTDGVTSKEFAKCVVGDEKYGIPGVTFGSTKGDHLKYALELVPPPSAPFAEKSNSDSYSVQVIENAVKSSWTFECLAKFISDTAQVDLPKNSLAGEIAITAIIRNLDPSKPEYHKETTLREILDRRLIGGKDGLQRLIEDITANLDDTPVDSDCDPPAGQNRETSKRGLRFGSKKRSKKKPRIPPNTITSSNTVEHVIDVVRSNL
ncbi:MAG: hypothetical protein JNL64_02040 [Blastocatellia bacterium]|nr:hypothetical protein [Blastocatellia bacterium]